MVFAAVGNLSESAFAKAAERYFGGDTAGGARAEEVAVKVATPNGASSGSGRRVESSGSGRRIAPPELVPFEEVVAKAGNHQAHCILGSQAYGLSDARRLPLSLLCNILGGPAANSRLNTVLRERNGLSYNVETIYQPFSDTGFAAVYFGCEKENLDKCRELVSVELQRVMETTLTARQLSMAKKQFLGQLVISMDASESYMLGMAKSCLVYNEIDSLQTIVGKVEAITADQMTEVAREVFGSLSSVTYR
jgi:predicted Zn-dependent peptidase